MISVASQNQSAPVISAILIRDLASMGVADCNKDHDNGLGNHMLRYVIVFDTICRLLHVYSV